MAYPSCADGRPDWMSADDPADGLTKAERERRAFEVEREKILEERRRGGQTTQRVANDFMGELLDDDELEEMKRQNNEEYEKEQVRLSCMGFGIASLKALLKPWLPLLLKSYGLWTDLME